jgi:hypothetical protein
MRGINPILSGWFVTVSDKLENWQQHEDVMRTCLGILKRGNVNDTYNKTSLRDAIHETVGDKGLGLPKAYLSFIALAFALHLQDAIFMKTGGRSLMKIPADMVPNKCEVIIGLEHQVLVDIYDNEQSLWTTRIDKFEKNIGLDNSHMTYLCLKSSLKKFSKTEESELRNEVEHLTEETPVQLDRPDEFEYTISSQIVQILQHHGQSSFSQWLNRLRSSLHEDHPDYEEVCNLQEILGQIDHQYFENVYVEGTDK